MIYIISNIRVFVFILSIIEVRVFFEECEFLVFGNYYFFYFISKVKIRSIGVNVSDF